MIQSLSPEMKVTMLEAGWSAEEVEAMTICQCGSGEPTLFENFSLCDFCFAPYNYFN